MERFDDVELLEHPGRIDDLSLLDCRSRYVGTTRLSLPSLHRSSRSPGTLPRECQRSLPAGQPAHLQQRPVRVGPRYRGTPLGASRLSHEPRLHHGLVPAAMGRLRRNLRQRGHNRIRILLAPDVLVPMSGELIVLFLASSLVVPRLRLGPSCRFSVVNLRVIPHRVFTAPWLITV